LAKHAIHCAATGSQHNVSPRGNQKISEQRNKQNTISCYAGNSLRVLEKLAVRAIMRRSLKVGGSGKSRKNQAPPRPQNHRSCLINMVILVATGGLEPPTPAL